MSGEVPAHLVAAVDQYRALLAELVGGVREHADADVCVMPSVCPGEQVAVALYALTPSMRHRLLYLALAELAARGYGLLPAHLATDPAEPVEPAVEPTTARRWWWPWRR
ncbi:hypothetical protein [Micromonospora haikouensis]|uniref:hypothetical protein n=1 Tax=Micromonospora haikouensis TaxID=686309 RepID=UPI003D73050F